MSCSEEEEAESLCWLLAALFLPYLLNLRHFFFVCANAPFRPLSLSLPLAPLPPSLSSWLETSCTDEARPTGKCCISGIRPNDLPVSDGECAKNFISINLSLLVLKHHRHHHHHHHPPSVCGARLCPHHDFAENPHRTIFFKVSSLVAPHRLRDVFIIITMHPPEPCFVRL